MSEKEMEHMNSIYKKLNEDYFGPDTVIDPETVSYTHLTLPTT